MHTYNDRMAERPTSRRDFLHGKSAAEALSAIGDAEHWAEADGQASDHAGTVAMTLTRRAMACDFQVKLNASATQNETEAAMAALDVVERVEDRLTVYRSESELIELNRQAAEGPAEVEDDIFDLLMLADQLFHATQGAYDITGGPLSQAWGFSRRAGQMPTEEQLAAARQRTGWQHVRLDPAARTIEFLKPDIEINFNSMGKGWALDLAADVMLEQLVDDCQLNGGRSTLLARGSQLGDEHLPGWGVGLRHPLRPQQRFAVVRLNNAAFSTSGSATQCFIHEGRRYGHLIDPRTGWPAEGLHSVSVIAPTAAEADALSTAFYVMGHQAAASYLRSHPQVQALFVLPSSKAGSVELRGGNLAPECWHLAQAAENLT